MAHTESGGRSLITVRSAAERLGVSYSTLKQWIYKGTIRTVRTGGGHHRIADSEIDRMLAAQDRPAKSSRASRRSTGVLVAISGRNQLRGIVEEIRVDGLLAQVRLRIADQRLTAVITRDAVEELKLKRGATAIAIIKATEVMVAREQDRIAPDESGRRTRARNASRNARGTGARAHR